MDRAGSKSVRNTADFQAQPAEVQQQAHMQPGRFQVVYALRGVHRGQRPTGFQFDDDRSLSHQISDIVPDSNATAIDGDALLLDHRKPCLAQFMGKGILIDGLKEPRPERVQNVKRAPHDTLRQRIGPDVICVHLRASAAKFLFERTTPHPPSVQNPTVARRP
jgi:hypothetical protein